MLYMQILYESNKDHHASHRQINNPPKLVWHNIMKYNKGIINLTKKSTKTTHKFSLRWWRRVIVALSYMPLLHSTQHLHHLGLSSLILISISIKALLRHQLVHMNPIDGRFHIDQPFLNPSIFSLSR